MSGKLFWFFLTKEKGLIKLRRIFQMTHVKSNSKIWKRGKGEEIWGGMGKEKQEVGSFRLVFDISSSEKM